MKVIAYESAKVTLIFPFEETVPLGGINGRKVVSSLTARYSVARPPDLNVSREEIDNKGIRFESGEFLFEGEPTRIISFAAYSDGIVVEANTTERAEAFLNDVVTWLRAEFGFREFTTPTKKFFISQMVVEFEKPITKLISTHTQIAEALNNEVVAAYGTASGPMALSRLDFDFDRATAGQTGVQRFLLERRVGVPYSQERYYAGAPIPTARHVALLENIEKMIP